MATSIGNLKRERLVGFLRGLHSIGDILAIFYNSTTTFIKNQRSVHQFRILSNEVKRPIMRPTFLIGSQRDHQVPGQVRPLTMKTNEICKMYRDFIFIIKRTATIEIVTLFIQLLRVHRPVGGICLNYIKMCEQ